MPHLKSSHRCQSYRSGLQCERKAPHLGNHESGVVGWFNEQG